MSKSLTAEVLRPLQTFSIHWGIEAAAAELINAGGALFRDGEPADPEMQRRYRYKRVEAGHRAILAWRAPEDPNLSTPHPYLAVGRVYSRWGERSP